MKEIVFTEKAPPAIGPYSQAVKAGGFLYTSGQIPLDPVTGEMVTGSIKVQAVRVFENLKAVLNVGGAELEDVVKVTVFVQSMADFTAINEVYAEYFKAPYPARTLIQAAGLPRNAGLEIEAVAILKA